MSRFLIIQTAFIGDVVLATGILEKLHRFYPDARIDFLLRKGNEGLLADHPFLHELMIWDKKAGKIKDLFRLLKLIRANRYDKVINVQRFTATGILTAFSGAKETIGYRQNPLSFLFRKRIEHRKSKTDQVIHEITRCNDLIESFTDSKPFLPVLYPSAMDTEKINAYTLQPFILIAPASVWFTKQFPASKWIEFLQQLPLALNVFLIGAPGDEALAQQIIQGAANPKVISLCGQLSFLQSAALMRKSQMNFVNDSAPMHFASAMNAPTAAIYCSTIPAFGYGPLSDNSVTIEIQEKLSCRPCGSHGYTACPEGHFACALKVQSNQLLNVLPPSF